MNIKYLTCSFVILFSVSSWADKAPDEIGLCVRNLSAYKKVWKDHQPDQVIKESMYQIGCENHKDAESCVASSTVKGTLGLDEVAMGYLRMACVLDSTKCGMVKVVKCLIDNNDDPECTRGNINFKTPEQIRAEKMK